MKFLQSQEEGYMTVDGPNPAKPLTPSMTPLSETSSFAQSNQGFGATGTRQTESVEDY